ncbi:acetyl-CoA C-acetyltransferase [Thermomonospora echinospora]|uniref:Acetyl-CoA C-acetyltransferase n=1 Tax=Thermomonospora echinospora TaxID=1992 RepID=A0A1H5T6X1_9ACTN|nr:thiolase family protein [Thermomonospora echinospora]SEF58529.1 acetyl-CoA C-acetyltransferase [Thermomonospora echinospora]
MTDAVIVSAARTPIGRAHKGSLVDVDAFRLARVAVGAAVDRSGVPVTDIDDLVLAESLQGGGVIGRYVAVESGLAHVPGLADNRHCAAGLSAIQIAAGSIRAGMDRVVVAGGTESLSSMPRVSKSIPASARDLRPWMSPSHPETPQAPAFDMPLTVGENTARLAGVGRAEADEWALRSHRRAAASVAAGHFADEIVPVELPDGRLFDTDEHPRADTTAERLAQLPVLHPELDGAVITAGNSAGLNDAAAAVVLTAGDYARANGLTPLARVVAWASVGVQPERTGLAPTLAVPKALDRAGLKIADIDLYEINEAFTTVAAASARILGIDPDALNVNGSGCGLGHPIAATGARMVVTMLGELRRRGGTFGCVSMCAGGGMGSALVLELL